MDAAQCAATLSYAAKIYEQFIPLYGEYLTDAATIVAELSEDNLPSTKEEWDYLFGDLIATVATPIMLQYQADGMEYLHDLNKKLSVQALKDLFKDMMDAEIVSYYDQGIRSITDLWPFLTQCQKLVYNNFLVLNSIIDQSDAETVYHLIVDSLINFGVTECDLKIIGGNSFYLYCNNYNVLEVVKFLDQMGLIVQMCQENLTDENTPYYWTGLIDVDGYVKTLVIGSWDFADEITIVKRTSSSASNRSVAPSLLPSVSSGLPSVVPSGLPSVAPSLLPSVAKPSIPASGIKPSVAPSLLPSVPKPSVAPSLPKPSVASSGIKPSVVRLPSLPKPSVAPSGIKPSVVRLPSLRK